MLDYFYFESNYYYDRIRITILTKAIFLLVFPRHSVRVNVIDSQVF